MHHPKDWPYVGYGHQVQLGEPYRRGVQLTEAQAYALLRKDLRKFCALYSQYGKDSIQLDCLAYNCGSGVVNKNSILKKVSTLAGLQSSPRYLSIGDIGEWDEFNPDGNIPAKPAVNVPLYSQHLPNH